MFHLSPVESQVIQYGDISIVAFGLTKKES